MAKPLLSKLNEGGRFKPTSPSLYFLLSPLVWWRFLQKALLAALSRPEPADYSLKGRRALKLHIHPPLSPPSASASRSHLKLDDVKWQRRRGFKLLRRLSSSSYLMGVTVGDPKHRGAAKADPSERPVLEFLIKANRRIWTRLSSPSRSAELENRGAAERLFTDKSINSPH